MEQRYQNLIEEVSDLVTNTLFDDAEWLEENHRLELDELMFQLMMFIGLATLTKLFARLCQRRVEFCRTEGMCVWNWGDPITVSTRVGSVEVPSPYMRNDETGESARPMKEVFGLRGKGKSLALERALSDFGSEDSYGEAERIFEEHYGFNVGRTSILRVTNKVGDDAETYLEARLAEEAEDYQLAPHEREVRVAELIAQLDGCDIRTGRFMTAQRAGRTVDYEPDDLVREEEWKEVRVGLVRRPGQASKCYVCRIGEYSTICDQLFALAVSLGLTPDTLVVSPGDGGNGLKESLEVVFPQLQFILDYPHLKDHFYETAEALGIDDELQTDWVKGFLHPIWEGELDDVRARLEALQRDVQNDRLRRLLKHLERFSECVDYETYEANDWPTGSGEVESAHKYLPQARLKLPGACWKIESINPMMAIRVIKKNGWWDDFWQWRLEQKKAA